MRVNYSKHNYCGGCEKTYPKTELRCETCRLPLRTKSHNTGTASRRKLVEEAARY